MVPVLLLALLSAIHITEALIEDVVDFSEHDDEVSLSLLQLKVGFRVRSANFDQANSTQEDNPDISQAHALPASFHNSTALPPTSTRPKQNSSSTVGFADQPKTQNGIRKASKVSAPPQREAREELGFRAAALRDVEALQESLSASEPDLVSASDSHSAMAAPKSNVDSISKNTSLPSLLAAARRAAKAGLAAFEVALGRRPSEQWTPRAAMSLIGEELRSHDGPRGALLPILAILFLMLVVIALVAASDSGVEQQKPLMPRGLWAAQSTPLVSSTALPSSSIIRQSCSSLPVRFTQSSYQQQSLGASRPSSCRPSLAPATSLPQLLFAPQQPPVRPDMRQQLDTRQQQAIVQQSVVARQPTISQQPEIAQHLARTAASQRCTLPPCPEGVEVAVGPESPYSNLPKLNLGILSHGPAPSQPAMLCPALVMPHCETLLAVSVERLLAGEGVAQVLGISGTPLLQVAMRRAQGSHFIDFAMAPARSPTLGSMVAGPTPGALELRGPDGRRLGELRSCGSGVHVLTMGSREALTVVQDAQGRIRLYAPGGQRPSAEACREHRPDILAGAEILTVRVEPGEDAVLALACVVSATLYGSRASITSSAGSSPVAPARALRAKG